MQAAEAVAHKRGVDAVAHKRVPPDLLTRWHWARASRRETATSASALGSDENDRWIMAGDAQGGGRNKEAINEPDRTARWIDHLSSVISISNLE